MGGEGCRGQGCGETGPRGGIRGRQGREGGSEARFTLCAPGLRVRKKATGVAVFESATFRFQISSDGV